LVDIDIKSEISPEDEALIVPGEGTKASPAEAPPNAAATEPQIPEEPPSAAPEPSEAKTNGKHATLATPAVRHMVKELNINITDVSGTGKDGRVLKEDVQRHAAAQKEPSAPSISRPAGEDKTLPLTPIQSQMFKSMTRSLTIPHFLYTDTIDFTNLLQTRRKLNASFSKTPTPSPSSDPTSHQPLTTLPFIIKAVSLALHHHPLLNSTLDTTTNPSKPTLHQRAAHNFAIAIDTPAGLVVPVLRAVDRLSIRAIAAELRRLSSLARAGRLAPADFADATFTISNIGSIGGGVAAPVIVPPQVGILAVGRARAVPRFDEEGKVVRREECVFSWSADHRVVDGAAAARCAERVKGYLEDVEGMLVELS
jgi:2-oxoisovalerate dehydrogenase E2 component (dihydrolipoyl transacylase)